MPANDNHTLPLVGHFGPREIFAAIFWYGPARAAHTFYNPATDTLYNVDIDGEIITHGVGRDSLDYINLLRKENYDAKELAQCYRACAVHAEHPRKRVG